MDDLTTSRYELRRSRTHRIANFLHLMKLKPWTFRLRALI